MREIVIACIDGLKGFPEAIEAAFPKTTVQLCVVHMVRNSLAFVNWKEWKLVAQDLRAIYARRLRMRNSGWRIRGTMGW